MNNYVKIINKSMHIGILYAPIHFLLRLLHGTLVETWTQDHGLDCLSRKYFC